MKVIFIILWSFFSIVPVLSQVKANLSLSIDSIINPLVNTNNYSGTVLVAKDGTLLFAKPYGKMSLEYDLDNELDSKFFIASVSMIFTSAAILKLSESGKINLKDKVSKYIPDYKHGQNLTISDLLSQRSGIPAIGSKGNVDYDSITKFEHTSHELYSYFKDYELLFHPGDKYNHGRSDYILLANIIERITGKTFGEYLHKEVFSPLEMGNTGHYVGQKEIVKNLANGYAPKNLYDLESAYKIDWSSKTGHGSIYSTVNDLQKFASAVLDNNFLSKESWDIIFKNYGDNVGYGWFIHKHLNRDLYQMNGRSPGFSSYLGIYPEENLIIIVLSNNYVSLPSSVGRSIGALCFNEKFESLNLIKKTLEPIFVDKLVGSYKFDENFYIPNFELTILSKDGNLYSEWGGLIPIDYGNKNFKEYILRTYWSSIVFFEDESGNISHMNFDDHIGLKSK